MGPDEDEDEDAADCLFDGLNPFAGLMVTFDPMRNVHNSSSVSNGNDFIGSIGWKNT